jgi:arabinose-5-phosphate isomerase
VDEADETTNTIVGRTILRQAFALLELEALLKETDLEKSVEILANSRLVITLGVGKSGYIAAKIADTLTSVGTPSLFLSAEQSLHGGMKFFDQEGLAFLIISKSGETQELLDIFTHMRYTSSNFKILITSNIVSSLAQIADVILSYACEECELGIIPTTSTTISLVIGDALAMALLRKNALTLDEFAYSHPGGSLGRTLSSRRP